MKNNKLSVVTSLFRSEDFVDEFFTRMSAEILKCGFDNFEIIFVDDGSPDQSAEIVRRLATSESKVKLIELSRNFGQHNALHAGLDNCDGKFIFLIDVDLEEQPEWLSIFLSTMKEQTCDVVFGVQKKRKGDFFERISGAVWYKILSFTLPFKHEQNITTARLMTRRYVNSMRLYQEKTAIISGIFALAGFKQVPVSVKKASTKGSGYTILKKIDLVFRTIIGLTNRPLIFAMVFNGIFAVLAFVFSLYLVLDQFFSGTGLVGWTSTALLITSSYLLQSLVLTLIGAYIITLGTEIKNRPRYIVKSDSSKKSN